MIIRWQPFQWLLRRARTLSPMQRRDKDDLVTLLQLIVPLPLELPVRVVYENEDARPSAPRTPEGQRASVGKRGAVERDALTRCRSRRTARRAP